MPETPAETPETALARTTLSERDLLIHALQHLEVQGEQINALQRKVDEIHTVGMPLLRKFASRRGLFK